MSFIDHFTDLMPDSVRVQPGYNNEDGDFIASGSVISPDPRARIEGKKKLVRTGIGGQQVISSVQLYLGGVYGLTTDRHRYTIPDRYDPHESITAVAVEVASDEDGVVMEVVYLP